MKSTDINKFKDFNKAILKYFILCSILFISSSLVTALIFQNKHQYVTNFINSFNSSSISLDKPIWQIFIFIFLSNLAVCTLNLFLSYIPFLFIPVITSIYNGYSLGIAIAATIIHKGSVLSMLLFGIMPHGIIEIPTILYTFGIGTFLCKNNTLSIIKKRKYDNNISTIKKIYIYIIVPLLLLAALIEAFITPRLSVFVK